MPTYRVTDPRTGVVLDLTGDAPPTDADLDQIFSQYQPPKPEDQSVFRQVADVPLKAATGVAQGVRFLTDAFGADNAASQNIRGVEDYLSSLLSAQSKQDSQEVARIFQEAEDKGLGEQLTAGLRAFATAPVDFLAQGIGTAVPTIAGGLAGAALRGGTLAARAATAARVGTGIGAVGGAGIVKSTIYDEVKRELEALGLPEDVIEERAKLAQEYGGENLDQILLGAGLGGLAAGTGLEKALASRILKNVATSNAASKGTLTKALFAGAKEAAPEFIQAAQEQAAGNIALQREGFEDIPTMRGVASAAALEGAVGFGLGAGIEIASPTQQAEYNLARANITNEVDRQREAELRQEEERRAAEFRAALEAENQRRMQGQADQTSLDAEAAAARVQADAIDPPTQDEVNQLATPMRGPDVSNDVQFGVAYGQKIARNLGDYFPNFGQFSVQQGETVRDQAGNPQPTFTIIDTEGKRYGQPLKTFEQANATAFSLNKEVVNQNVRGAILNSLETAGQAYDPDTTQSLFSYGYRTLNPDANTFSAVSLNEAAKTVGPDYAEALSWRQIEGLPKAKDRRGRVLGYQYTPEGGQPRIIKGLTKAQEINKSRSQEGKPESNVFSLEETKSALGKSFPAITKDVPIDPKLGKKGAVNQIADLIRSKNIISDIASPEVNALAKGVTGKGSVKEMDYGDIRLFHKKLSSLPRFERETKLPVFEFKPYNRENFVRASKFIQGANARGVTPTDDQIIEAARLPKEYPKVDETLAVLKQDLSKQGVKVAPKPVLALPAPPGGVGNLVPIRKALRQSLRGYGLNDIALNIERNLIQPTGEIAGEETEAFFDPRLKQIFLAVDRVDPDGSLTPEQRLNALNQVMGHEVIHAARLLDLWKQDEWSNLENAITKVKKPGTNQTYFDIAKTNYSDRSGVIQIEEAVADMFRDYTAKQLKVSGRPQNLLERMAQFFQRLRSALTGTGFQTYGDILSRFERGEVGGRQRGEIRTLRATEAALSRAGTTPERLAGILGGAAPAPAVVTPAAATAPPAPPAARPRATSDLPPEMLQGAEIMESRLPPRISVEGESVPTTNAEGRPIFIGGEGLEQVGRATRNTEQGLTNFWRWFGKSKAKDSQGRPQVFYHGTGAIIDRFRPKQAGSVFVTKSPAFAEEFAFLSDNYMVSNFPDFMSDQQVLDVLNEALAVQSSFSPPLYEKMRAERDRIAKDIANGKAINPKSLQAVKDVAAEGRSSRYLNAIQTRLPSSGNLMPVYVKADKPWDYDNREDVRAVVRRARENGADITASMVEEIGQGNWQTIEGSDGNAPILDAIRELGYDSMFVEEQGEKNLAVFNPNQVKSAVGNTGDFGLETDLILESRSKPPRSPLADIVTPEEAEGRIRRRLAREPGVGAPRNERVELTVPGRPSFLVGKITNEDWLNRVNTLMSMEEIKDARGWYRQLDEAFRPIFGDETPKYALAWLLSQKRASPTKGFTDVLRAADMAVGKPEIKKAGLNQQALIDVLSDRVPEGGVGDKLLDFLDSELGLDTRTVVRGDVRGRQPAAIDVWAQRDIGFVDPTVQEYIRKNFGNEAANRLQVDKTTSGETQYEYGIDFYNDVAEMLNRQNFDGGGWTAREVQAVGWVTMQRAMGVDAEFVRDIIGGNTRRVSIGLAPGANSVLADKLAGKEIPVDVAQREIGFLANLAGIKVKQNVAGVGAYLQWLEGAIQLDAVASPEAVDDFMDMVGYAFQQTEIINTRSLKSGKNMAIDILSPNLDSVDNATKFFSKFLEFAPKNKEGDPIAPGFQQILIDGMPGIRLLNFGGKWRRNEVEKIINAANDAAEQTNVELDRSIISQVVLSSTKNDWKENRNGEAYLGSLRDRGRLQEVELLQRRYPPSRIDLAGDGTIIWQGQEGQQGAAKAAAEVTPIERPQAQLDQAVENARADIESTPAMAIPLYNLAASPDALYVAQNPEQGLKLTPDDEVRYSRQNQPNYRNPNIRTILDQVVPEPPNQDPVRTVINSMRMSPFRDTVDKLRQNAIFNFSRLEFYNQNHPSLMHNTAAVSSLAAAEFADRSKAIFAAAITEGVPVYVDGGFRVDPFVHNGRQYKGLIDVLAPLYNNQYNASLEKLAQAYAVAKRGERLSREGKAVPADAAFLQEIEQEANQYINPATGQPIIREWYDAWQAYNANTVKFLRDTGMIDDAAATKWLNQSDYYPFYRTDKTGKDISDPSVFGGNLTTASTLKALRGSEEGINVPLMEAILSNLDAAIAMGMKNVAQQRIVRDMVNIGMGRFKQPGENVEGKPTVNLKVNGKRVTAFIDDPLIFESMQAIPDVNLDGLLGNLFRVPATVLRELIVREPGYLIANMARDTVSVLLTSGANIIPAVDTARNFNRGLDNLARFGVVGGYDFARDPQDVVKFLSDEARKRGHEIPVREETKWDEVVNSAYMRPLKGAWDFLGTISDKAEASTRNAVYEDTLKRTGDWVEAAYQALSVINYGRRGRNPQLRLVTATVPFLNARIQGLDKLYQAATGTSGVTRDRRKNIQRFVVRAGLMVGLTGLYYAMISDDELYDNENQEVKDNYYLIPIKKADLANREPGFAVKIPIPFEVGILFKTIPERILDMSYGDTTSKDLRDSLLRATTSTLAFNPVPQAILPILETVANYDTFTGRPIVPTYMQDRNAIAQARFGTNELARRAGEATGISPLKLDHLMNGYLGSLGTYTLDAADTLLRDNDMQYPQRKWFEYPFVRRFFTTAMRPGLQEQFYELDKNINGIVGSINALKDQGRVDELQAYMLENENILQLKSGVNVLDKLMKRYRDQKDAILRMDIDPAEKRRIIDELDRNINLQLKVMPQLRRLAYDEQRQAG
jgi:hypothetical protein